VQSIVRYDSQLKKAARFDQAFNRRESPVGKLFKRRFISESCGILLVVMPSFLSRRDKIDARLA
jgi:hypothetical protein